MKKFEYKTLLPTIYVLSVLTILILIIKVMKLLMPITIGLIIVFTVLSIAKKFNIKTKLGKSILLSVFYLLIIILSISLVVSLTIDGLDAVNAVYANRYEILNDITKFVEEIGIPERFIQADILYKIVEKSLTSLSSASIIFINKVITFTSSIPKMIFFTIVMILSSYIMLYSNEQLIEFFKKQIPDSWMNKISSIRTDVFKIMIDYLKVQVILICCTAIQVIIGLRIINLITGGQIEYVLLMSVFVIIVDALPIFGSGSVFIPWSVIELINGSYVLAISLLVLFGIIVVMRYF